MKPIAVVTGAAGGIGAAVARRLAPTYRLVLADVALDGLEAVAATIDPDARAELVVCDVCSSGDVAALVQRATALGDVTGLVNVAGIGPVQTDDGMRILEVDLRATARITEALKQAMPPGSAVVSIGSVASSRSPQDADALLVHPLDPGWDEAWAKRPPDAWSAYSYSKRGLMLYTRRRAAEWAGDGVRINIVAPSQTATALGKASIAEHPEIAAFVSRIPMGRMAEPEEVANAVAFLLGDQSTFITGIELFVDGGAEAAGASMKLPT